MEALFENEYIQININRKNRFIEYQLKKCDSSEDYINSMEMVYDYVCQNNCNKVLPVLMNRNPIPHDARIWSISNWFPRMVKQGVRTYAIVNIRSDYVYDPKDKLKAIYDRRNTGVTIVYFNDVDEARSWMSSLL